MTRRLIDTTCSAEVTAGAFTRVTLYYVTALSYTVVIIIVLCEIFIRIRYCVILQVSICGVPSKLRVEVGADKVTNLLMWRPSDHGPYCLFVYLFINPHQETNANTILHEAQDDAVKWLDSVAVTALAK